MAEKERVWHDLELYQIDDYLTEESWSDGFLDTKIEIFRKLRPGQYIPVDYMDATCTNTIKFQNRIEYLRRAGLDIGKGDAEYGYQMPLPKKGDEKRELRIFRRR